MSTAYEMMHNANPNALIGQEGPYIVMIEHVTDPDGRMYNMEYQSTHDGHGAVAYCRYNPWSRSGKPQAGEDLLDCHVFSDGLICMGDDHSATPSDSPHNLQTVINRARFWCTAFSVFKETRHFPNP